jgi:hypothetical protein
MDGAIDGQEVLGGEFVAPLDFDGLAAGDVEGGTGALPFESPKRSGWKLRVKALAELQHADAVVVDAAAGRFRMDARGDGERVDEAVEASGAAGRIEGRESEGNGGSSGEAKEITPVGESHRVTGYRLRVTGCGLQVQLLVRTRTP